MRLRMDLDGITAELQIQKYTKQIARTGDEYDYWCKVSFSFFSEPWLNYNNDNEEVFLSCEVDDLARSLEDLLNDRLPEPKVVEFIEPDFCFELFPKEDLRNDPRILYIKPGQEIADISTEWKVFFWYGGLTANHLTVALNRENIINLKNYLFWVTGKYDETTPEIVEMKKSGILY